MYHLLKYIVKTKNTSRLFFYELISRVLTEESQNRGTRFRSQSPLIRGLDREGHAVPNCHISLSEKGSKIEKVPRSIQGDKLRKDTASSVKLVLTIGA